MRVGTPTTSSKPAWRNSRPGRHRQVICGLSGGVDSSVAAALVHKAIGDQLTCVFVDTGMLRKGEGEQVIETFEREQGIRLIAVNAAEEFLEVLSGVTDPEEKRKRIGEKFIRIFESQVSSVMSQAPANATSHMTPDALHTTLLCQGTLYPDVIESAWPRTPDRCQDQDPSQCWRAAKGHEIRIARAIALFVQRRSAHARRALGLPDEIVWRQPFPGPGLAVRCWARLRGSGWSDCALPTTSCNKSCVGRT